MKLSDKALLVQLKVSQMTGRKYDRRATEQVAQQNGATMMAGRYNKSLFPVNDHLTHIHQKTTLIRKKYYNNTLPWGLEGTQILPSANYLNFMTDFRKEKSEWQLLVDTFFKEYPKLTANAQTFLGQLYNKADYPPLYEVQRKFSMDMTVMPVPSSDFRCEGLDNSELVGIRSDIDRQVYKASQNAMKEAWQRLYDRVKHMAETLADPAKNFKNTLVENTQDICSVLTRLNFADDPNLEELRQEVEGKLANNHPESLRNDPDLRRDKASEAREIMDKMGAFMGGK